MDNNKLEDLSKSYELADIINRMKPIIHEMDLDYAKEAIAGMRNLASFNDSAAILNPMYDPTKTDHLYLQCKALSKLIEYVELLKECDKLKAKCVHNDARRSEISKMFL